MRKSTSPSFAYGATVGFVEAFINSIRRASTADSPIPNIFNVFDTKTRSVCSEHKIGLTHFRKSGSSSRGGPGSIKTILLSFFIHSPGAVPFSLYKTVPPSGTSACFMLFSVITRPRRIKYSSMCFFVSSSVRRGIPSSSHTVSFVISSYVGPSPPEVMTISARFNASVSALISLSRLSPTTV
ncbi:hypothetical protein SDC9_104276 [bioreactor metagenome]|uniref:Uncharacterized protein n=1 Tax=bioreactor metagenome TaxID=1076179 RepID=A0A645B6W7_9ZZZZ